MLARLGDWYRSAFGHALVGAALLWAALPPLDAFYLWPLAWVAPVWWLLLVRRPELTGGRKITSAFRKGTVPFSLRENWDSPQVVRRPILTGRRPYAQLWLVGFLFWLAALHWLSIPNLFTAIGWVALSFYLGFYLPVFIGLSRVAVHRLHVPMISAAPVVWMGLELARGHLLTGFTMASLGHTQYRWIGLIQLSDLAGAYGVGFVVMCVAACLARTLPTSGKPWAFWPLAPVVLLLGGAILYGEMRVSDQPANPEARIALIQGSIDTVLNPKAGTRDRMRQEYWKLSKKAVADYGEPDLIVWPETAFGGFLVDYQPQMLVPDDWEKSEAEFRLTVPQAAAESHKPLRALAEHLGAPVLVGLTTLFLSAEGEKRYNSAVFVPRGDEPLGRYDKMHLVAFGEYIPFAKELSWLVPLTPLNTLGLIVDPGKESAAFDVAGLRIAPNICYESVMPHVIRRQVNTLAQKGREPDVLVNLTNDGWFFGSAELDMHLVCGVFRAVECRKPFLVAANTGFSAWIDADGRILARGPRREEGTILAQVGADGRSSWYLAHGDWPAGVCLAACLVFGAVGGWDRLGNRRKAKAARAKTKPTG